MVKMASGGDKGRDWSASTEVGHAGMGWREQGDRGSVCCLCGCEDNEQFEALVKPCGCSGCSVVVHSSCASAVNVGGPHKEQRVQRLGVCWFCGSRARDGAGSDTKLAKGCRSGQEASDGGDGQGGKEEQMGAARKRLRSNSGSSGGGGKGEQQGVKALAKNPRSEAGANAVQSERVQAEASPTDSKKLSSPFLGRRFSDAAANVPIKKRRIQLEVVRSPSPPPPSSPGSPEADAEKAAAEEGVGGGEGWDGGRGGKAGGSANGVGGADAQAFVGEAGGVGLMVCENSGPADGCEGEVEQGKGRRDVGENGRTGGGKAAEEGSGWRGDVGAQGAAVAGVDGEGSMNGREEEGEGIVGSGVAREEVVGASVQRTGGAVGESEGVVEVGRERGAAAGRSWKRKFSDGERGDGEGGVPRAKEWVKARSGERGGSASLEESGASAGENSMLRDDRLHWDLNMDMEEWGTVAEEESGAGWAERSRLGGRIGAEKRESMRANMVQESEGGVRKRAAQGGADAGSGAEGRVGSVSGELEVEVGVEEAMAVDRKGEAGLARAGSGNGVSESAEWESRETVSSMWGGGGLGESGGVEEHGETGEGSETVILRSEGGARASALQEDDGHRGGNIGSDVGAEVGPGAVDAAEGVGGEEAKAEVEGVVDEVIEGDDVATGEEGGAVMDGCRSGGAVFGAGSCGVREEVGGRCSVEDVRGECSDGVEVEKQGGERLRRTGEGEEEVGRGPAREASVDGGGGNGSPVRSSVEAGRCDEVGGGSQEHEKSVEEVDRGGSEGGGSPSRQVAGAKWEGDNGEDLEGDDVDYGDSDMRVGDDVEMEGTGVQRGGVEVESAWKGEGDAVVCEVQGGSGSESQGEEGGGMMGRERRHGSGSSGGEESQGMESGKAYGGEAEEGERSGMGGKSRSSSERNGGAGGGEEKCEEEHGNGSGSGGTCGSRGASLERTEGGSGAEGSGRGVRKSEVRREGSEGGSRSRAKSGWDQLPEGFQSAEEALQAARSNAGQAGWGSAYGCGYAGWNGNSSTHFGSGENRYLSGHGRGMVVGPAGERGAFDKVAWSRGEHARRSRVDVGLEMHGRVGVGQEMRHGSGGRARPSSLEAAHRQPRRRGVWGEDAGGAGPLWAYGAGRALSPSGAGPGPGPGREAFGFHPQKARNAAAVAAAKVESSGLVVAPDGTVIKAGGGGQGGLRGLGGKGRGGGFTGMVGDMGSNGMMGGVGNAGLAHPMRMGGDVDLRGRECLGVDARVAGGMGMGSHCVDPALRFKGVGERFGPGPGPGLPPGVGSSMGRGGPGMMGGPDRSRFTWTRGDGRFAGSVEQDERGISRRRGRRGGERKIPGGRKPPRSMSNNEEAGEEAGGGSEARKSRSAHGSEAKVEGEGASVGAGMDAEGPGGQQGAPSPPKLPLPPPPPRAQRSPPAGLKRLLNNKREEEWPRGRERSRERERERVGSRGHYSPSRRSSPHVIHGSALTDERDRLLLAGIDRSREPGASGSGSTEEAGSHRGRSMEGGHEGRRAQHHEGRRQEGESHAGKGEELTGRSRAQSKDEGGRGGDGKESRAESERRSASRGGSRRESQKPGGESKHSSSREGEDDVAPRRRRPS
uniref:Uncharacterized protein n=1 Tax=Physcomitrium patens TaxID=3218 RepID=A0A7I4C374_PHYPA